jgi:hypothetical protein
MAEATRRSKKRSVASSPRPPDEPILFLDRALGNKVVANLLRSAGACVEIHSDHFEEAAADADWLLEVGRRGWAVLTKDRGIRRRVIELAAIRRGKVRAFALTSAGRSGEEMATAFIRALSQIRKLCKHKPPPFVATVTAAGKVSIEVEW